MLPIKLNNLPYSFPTEVSELSLKQFFALRQSKGILDEVCALTGIDRETILNFKGREDLEQCQLLLNNLGQKLALGMEGKTLPKQTNIAGKTIRVPKNLKLEPVGAFIAVHNLITEEQKRAAEANIDFDPTNIIPQVLAHYFWLPYMGDGALYNDEKVEQQSYMDQILTIPITDAVPIANFFFSEVSKLITEQATLLHRPTPPDEKRAQADKLNQFGWMLSIDTLANSDITRWNHVLTQSYDRVIVKLLINRERMEYQKRYAEAQQTNR